MKTQIDNARGERMGRGGWRWDGALKSDMENAGEEGMGRGRRRVEG